MTMWNHNIGTTEQLIRILLALVLIGFSRQENTSLIQAIAGYLAGGWMLMSALTAQYLTWSRTDRTLLS
jgi:hypothetical protein